MTRRILLLIGILTIIIVVSANSGCICCCKNPGILSDNQTDESSYGDNLSDGSSYGDNLSDGSSYADNLSDGSSYGDNQTDGSSYGDNQTDGSSYADNLSDGSSFNDSHSSSVVQAKVSGDTITISGTLKGSGTEQNSTDFYLGEGPYIVSCNNTGDSGNDLTALLYNEDNTDVHTIADWNTKGSITLPIGSLFFTPGKYHLVVSSGDTYTVTIAKPTSGDAAPKTITAEAGETISTAMNLNPGTLKISVKYDIAPTESTSIAVYDMTGNFVFSDFPIADSSATVTATGTIPMAGIYVVSVTLPYSGGNGTVIISQ